MDQRSYADKARGIVMQGLEMGFHDDTLATAAGNIGAQADEEIAQLRARVADLDSRLQRATKDLHKYQVRFVADDKLLYEVLFESEGSIGTVRMLSLRCTDLTGDAGPLPKVSCGELTLVYAPPYYTYGFADEPFPMAPNNALLYSEHPFGGFPHGTD